MLGKNVLQPIGWDAFGLPAEGAAVKTTPRRHVDVRQHRIHEKPAQMLGFGYDWSRELATCTRNITVGNEILHRTVERPGVQKTSAVDWLPNDQTVLANEQVIDGCCWRCDPKSSVKRSAVVHQNHRLR
ncbi:hypothetical protein ACNKHK_04115 [Shigella flexneri]